MKKKHSANSNSICFFFLADDRKRKQIVERKNFTISPQHFLSYTQRASERDTAGLSAMRFSVTAAAQLGNSKMKWRKISASRSNLTCLDFLRNIRFTCHVFSHQSENFTSFTSLGCSSANSPLCQSLFFSFTFRREKHIQRRFSAVCNNSPSYKHSIENNTEWPHVGSLSWICCVCTQNLRWNICRTASFILQWIFSWIVQHHCIFKRF